LAVEEGGAKASSLGGIMDEKLLFELWREIYRAQVMTRCCAGDKNNKRVGERQEHFLRHSIDRHLDNGIRKDAAIVAFREVSYQNPHTREILKKYDEPVDIIP